MARRLISMCARRTRPIPTSSPTRLRAGISASRFSSSGLTEYPGIGSLLLAGPGTPKSTGQEFRFVAVAGGRAIEETVRIP